MTDTKLWENSALDFLEFKSDSFSRNISPNFSIADSFFSFSLVLSHNMTLVAALDHSLVSVTQICDLSELHSSKLEWNLRLYIVCHC